jgi:hypothetical protein
MTTEIAYLPDFEGWLLTEGVSFTDPQGQTYRSNYLGSCDLAP